MPRTPSHVAQPRIRDLIPPDGIMPLYLREASNLSPAPAVYHIASLLTMISAIVCPTCVLVRRSKHRSRTDLLHLWTIMCGPPNNGKSYSAKMARRVAAKSLRGRIVAPIGSLQGLEQALQQNPTAMLFADEFSRFLSENRASWMRGNGSQFWCKVFDGKMDVRNLQLDPKDPQAAPGERKQAAQPDEIDVRVTMLGAAATGSLVAGLKPGDWQGGFMSRALFIAAHRNEATDDWFDWPPQVQEKIERSLVDIEAFGTENREIGWDPQAYELYRSWFHSTEQAMEGFGPVHADALARLTRHVRVICALYAASAMSRLILLPMVRAAVALGDYAKLCTLSLPVPRATGR